MCKTGAKANAWRYTPDVQRDNSAGGHIVATLDSIKSLTTARRLRRAVPAVAVLVAASVVALSGPSRADVAAIRGEGFGYFVNATQTPPFGQPFVDGPNVTVELNPDASDSPESASVMSAVSQNGPAVFFSSGPIAVDADASLGASGDVNVTTDITGSAPRSDQPVTLQYDRVQSSCTATEDGGVTTSVTITNGTVATSADDTGPLTTQNVPTNPSPGSSIQGYVDVGFAVDEYETIFNEITNNADGSVTVTAVHVDISDQGQQMGNNVVLGDIYIGRATCGITDTTTPTTPPPTTVPPTTVPPTTVPPVRTRCFGELPTIMGTEGDDVIVGTSGPDVIMALGGDDVILGLEGDDLICAGDGNDGVIAGDGDDLVDAGTGDDAVVGRTGNDSIRGSSGDDRIGGGAGDARLAGGPGDDQVYGGPGTDACSGGSGADTIIACE